jgi:flavodoxin
MAMNVHQKFPVNALVAYFSVSGHTKTAAAAIASALSADLEQIESARPLPRNRIALYMFGAYAAKKKREWAAKPASSKLANYDLVIIGTPIWAWTLNPVVRGWLRANPIPAGVPYAAFATAGGAAGSGAFDDMAGIIGRKAIATMTIFDADRRSGEDARLIKRFVAGIEAAGTSRTSAFQTR